MDTTGTTSRAQPVRGRELGALIGGAFGAVFVWINSSALAAAVRLPLVIAAGIAVLAIIVLSIRSYRRSPAAGASSAHRVSTDADRRRDQRGHPPFGWAYWLVVGIEVVALIGGSRLITGLGYPELGVAWVAFVVGTHFFALARIFRLRRFHLLGALVTGCGLAGFALRLLGQIDAIALVSGVASGFVLLAFGLWALVAEQTIKAG